MSNMPESAEAKNWIEVGAMPTADPFSRYEKLVGAAVGLAVIASGSVKVNDHDAPAALKLVVVAVASHVPEPARSTVAWALCSRKPLTTRPDKSLQSRLNMRILDVGK